MSLPKNLYGRILQSDYLQACFDATEWSLFLYILRANVIVFGKQAPMF